MRGSRLGRGGDRRIFVLRGAGVYGDPNAGRVGRNELATLIDS